ncbi:MAG: imelysin family protein [Deltaproteobacteria bacterium]|jgi:putative iron-regulated protein
MLQKKLLYILPLTLVACSGGDDDDDNVGTSRQAVIARYAEVVHTSYSASLTTAQAMKVAIDAFVAAPSEATHMAAKQAWLDARVPYGQTEAYRFYDGPIDNPTDGPEGQLNAWPLDEAYIDYVEGSTLAGIVNDTSIDISKARLSSLNEGGEGDVVMRDGGAFDAEAAVSTGYHAIEFLLWGQDRNANGPGQRAYTDFLTDANATAPNGDRRGQYLVAVTELLIDDLTAMVDAWAPDAANYRADFEAADPDESLKKIIGAVGILSKGELAAERMDVALDTNDQEDEHSCFSDNTHVDIQMNAMGVDNVLRGNWAGTSGASILDLVTEADATLGADLDAALSATQAAVDGIPVPFDQAIVTRDSADWTKVSDAVNLLFDQGDKIAEIGPALGLGNISVELPE